MNTGIVFKISGETAVVLDGDGVFRRVPARPEWKKGDTVRLPQKKGVAARLFRKARYGSTIAASVLLMFSLISFTAYYYLGRTVTTISIDVNPSVELGLNSFDWVVSVKAYNGEGEDALAALKLIWMSAEDAVRAVIGSPGVEGYLEDNTVVVAVSSTSHQQAISSKVSGIVRDLTDAYGEADFIYSNPDWDLRKDARASEVSLGRMALARQIQQYDPGQVFEELLELSTSELVQLLKDVRP